MKSKPYVLLINPRMCRENALRLPLSLLALAAGLQDRYQYQLIDGNVDPNPRATALRALADHPNALVGVSVMPDRRLLPRSRCPRRSATSIRTCRSCGEATFRPCIPIRRSTRPTSTIWYGDRGKTRCSSFSSACPTPGTPERSRIDVESRRRPGRGWAQLEAVRRDRAQS